jgi:catechol 2,3-dioxygenase-like lactoylglutathione lyase family enzyme
MQAASADFYPFIEVSLACTDVDAMEQFWVDMFDGKVIFRGKMMGQRFSRIIVCGVTLAFREDPDMPVPPGPGEEFLFRNHLGLRVTDLDAAIERLEARGANFAMTPAMVRQFQQMKKDDGAKFLETDFVAPPLTAERMAAGEFKIDVAILAGPDNLWIELNEIHEPADTNWFPGA